jgi:glycosyltransferase involved in cell wall biosynthesis
MPKFIGRALAALLGQERAADEVVVIDDGSTDDSVAVIERIAAATPAIRMLRNPNNIGVISTLQRGLEAARGKYVYFAASDDWIFPGCFFALALRRLEADPDVGLFCREAMLIAGGNNRPFVVRPARARKVPNHGIFCVRVPVVTAVPANISVIGEKVAEPRWSAPWKSASRPATQVLLNCTL